MVRSPRNPENRPAGHKTAEVLLNVYHLTVRCEDGVTRLDDVKLTLRGGEILGVTRV